MAALTPHQGDGRVQDALAVQFGVAPGAPGRPASHAPSYPDEKFLL
jgi:hypothetical protein